MKKTNPEVEAFIVLVANSILFCHAANNTQENQQSCAKLCEQPLDYVFPNSNTWRVIWKNLCLPCLRMTGTLVG